MGRQIGALVDFLSDQLFQVRASVTSKKFRTKSPSAVGTVAIATDGGESSGTLRLVWEGQGRGASFVFTMAVWLVDDVAIAVEHLVGAHPAARLAIIDFKIVDARHLRSDFLGTKVRRPPKLDT